jgi:hypothetical protein
VNYNSLLTLSITHNSCLLNNSLYSNLFWEYLCTFTMRKLYINEHSTYYQQINTQKSDSIWRPPFFKRLFLLLQFLYPDSCFTLQLIFICFRECTLDWYCSQKQIGPRVIVAIQSLKYPLRFLTRRSLTIFQQQLHDGSTESR